MTTQICLLFAAERSGTHLLRSILGKAPGVLAPGEVANVRALSSRTEETSFLKFRKERWLSAPENFFATSEMQGALLDNYFDHIRNTYAAQKYVVLDVKYSHVHNFNAGWWDPSSRPFLIEYARERRIKAIHLVRTKVYRTAISQLYTQESGVWRAESEAAVKTVQTEIARARLERRARAIAHSIFLFERWLSQCDQMKIIYEVLSASRAPALAALKDFLGLEEDFQAEPKFVRTTPPYDQSITNYKEIADLVDVRLAQFRQTSPMLVSPDGGQDA